MLAQTSRRALVIGLLQLGTFGILLASTTAVASSIYTNTQTTGYEINTLEDGSIGETFYLGAANTLQGWSFDVPVYGSGNIEFQIAAWNGSSAVGPALYTSIQSNQSVAGPDYTFQTNLDLSGGAYIAYFTAIGIKDPTDIIELYGSESNAGLGGGAYYLPGSFGPPLSGNTWISTSLNPPDLYFSATFASPVTPAPIPATGWLMLSGLGALALARKRKASPPSKSLKRPGLEPPRRRPGAMLPAAFAAGFIVLALPWAATADDNRHERDARTAEVRRLRENALSPEQ